MTVQLNNIVNSTQGERAYNVDMAATHPDRAGAPPGLFRLRPLVRARHRRRRGERLTHHAAGDVDIQEPQNLASARLKVLEQLNLDVAASEFLVLLGPSGCGKSTFSTPSPA